MQNLNHLTRESLEELESAPRTFARILIDYTICLMPIIFGCLAAAEYIFVPNLSGNVSTNSYTYFLCVMILFAVIFFITALFSKKAFVTLRYKAPFYAFVFVLLILYDYMTLKTGKLVLPYFPWADQILNEMANREEAVKLMLENKWASGEFDKVLAFYNTLDRKSVV